MSHDTLAHRRRARYAIHFCMPVTSIFGISLITILINNFFFTIKYKKNKSNNVLVIQSIMPAIEYYCSLQLDKTKIVNNQKSTDNRKKTNCVFEISGKETPQNRSKKIQ